MQPWVLAHHSLFPFQPLHKASWFCVWPSFSRRAQILQEAASNIWFICHHVICDVPRMLQTSSNICTPHNWLDSYFPHFHQPNFMMEDLNIQNPWPKFDDLKHEYHSTFVPYLTFVWPCIMTNFFIINQTDALISQIYFGRKICMFQTVPLSIIRSFSLYTQQWYMSYRFADSVQVGSGWSCSQAVSKPVWHIPLLCVQWKPPDDGQRNCPKHVEFLPK